MHRSPWKVFLSASAPVKRISGVWFERCISERAAMDSIYPTEAQLSLLVTTNQILTTIGQVHNAHINWPGDVSPRLDIRDSWAHTIMRGV